MDLGVIVTDMLRWGVLGSSGINHKVVPAIGRSERCEVVAIASRDVSRARREAQDLGIPRAYGSYDELLADSAIDVVYISLPNFLHKEWTLAAIAAGKHVLCEKPMAITAVDACEMIDAATAAGVVVAEAFMYGHHPRYDQLQEVVESGEIGVIRSITGAFTFDASDEPEATAFADLPGAGAIYDIGCYVLHAARHLLHTEPLAVTALAQASPVNPGTDLMSCALVEFPDDVSLLMQCGMWAGDEDTLKITGSKGRIEIPSAFLCSPGLEGFTVYTEGGQREVAVPNVDHFTAEADGMAAVLLDGAQPRYALLDPIFGAAVLDAATRSWRGHTRVVLDH